MIQEFVDRFMKKKEELRSVIKKKQIDDYMELVKHVIMLLHDDDSSKSPDPERIHQIDDGDYQGTLVFIVADSSYQPYNYWYVKVGYGSCSGCDTLESIREYSDDLPTKQQVDEYMTLALHIIQGLKLMGDEQI